MAKPTDRVDARAGHVTDAQKTQVEDAKYGHPHDTSPAAEHEGAFDKDAAIEALKRQLKAEQDIKAAMAAEAEKLNSGDGFTPTEMLKMIKSGTEIPGYTVVPKDKAEQNPTVDKVIKVEGGDALVRLKKDAMAKFIPTKNGRRAGLVQGEKVE